MFTVCWLGSQKYNPFISFPLQLLVFIISCLTFCFFYSICVLSDLALLVDGSVLSDLALLVDDEVQGEELYTLYICVLSDLALLVDGQVQCEELYIYSLYLCIL